MMGGDIFRHADNRSTSMDSNDYVFTVNINNLSTGGNIVTQKTTNANDM